MLTGVWMECRIIEMFCAPDFIVAQTDVFALKCAKYVTRSPGLVVMGDDSCLRGRGFESRRHILDEMTLFKLICCKKCIVCLKKT